MNQKIEHKFWNHFDNFSIMPKEENLYTPYILPKEYEWYSIDIHSLDERKEYMQFLHENYLEDINNIIRVIYSEEFILWYFGCQERVGTTILCVRAKRSKKIVGTISGLVQEVKIGSQVEIAPFINFLCVHKNLRDKRLAPLLIKELIRYGFANKICNMAIFSSAKYLPIPNIGISRIYSRYLSPLKLLKNHFISLPSTYTKFSNPIEMFDKTFKLPIDIQNPRIRKYQDSNLEKVYSLYLQIQDSHSVVPIFSEKELSYWIQPRGNTVYTYVEHDGENKEILSFWSFYRVTYKILKSGETVECAFLSYFWCKNNPIENMKDILSIAKNEDFDLFNCYEMSNISPFIDECKFYESSDCLTFYPFNFFSGQINPEKILLPII